MKTLNRFISGAAFLALLIISNCLIAQTDKNELKLQKLKENVERYEARVAAKERKMEIADSLLTTGENMLFEAEDEFEIVDQEQIALDKEYKASYKELAKLQRSKDETIASKADDELSGARVDAFIRELLSAIEEVQEEGPPAKRTVSIDMPKNVEKITVDGGRKIIVEFADGENRIYYSEFYR